MALGLDDADILDADAIELRGKCPRRAAAVIFVLGQCGDGWNAEKVFQFAEKSGVILVGKIYGRRRHGLVPFRLFDRGKYRRSRRCAAVAAARFEGMVKCAVKARWTGSKEFRFGGDSPRTRKFKLFSSNAFFSCARDHLDHFLRGLRRKRFARYVFPLERRKDISSSRRQQWRRLWPDQGRWEALATSNRGSWPN